MARLATVLRRCEESCTIWFHISSKPWFIQPSWNPRQFRSWWFNFKNKKGDLFHLIMSWCLFSLSYQVLETGHETACQVMCGALKSPRMRQMPGRLATHRAARVICLSSAFREVRLLYTPCTVSRCGWRVIWQQIISTKEESILKSSKNRRGKCTDLT